jgi:hypothetical protein
MTSRAVFETYLAALRRKPITEKTEHTDRGALEALLAAFAAEAEGRPEVQHEPRRVAGKGAPDFKVVRKGLIQGYVENKTITSRPMTRTPARPAASIIPRRPSSISSSAPLTTS